MTAAAVAALPAVEPLPAPAGNVVDQGQHGRFLALLAAVPRSAEHHAARAAAGALGNAKTTAADDSAAASATPAPAPASVVAASAPATLPPSLVASASVPATPLPSLVAAAASAAAAPAPGPGSPPDTKSLLPAPAALAAAPLTGDAAQAIAVPSPGATTLPPATRAQPSSSDAAPAAQPSAPAAAPAAAPTALTPVQSMAASLGLRLVAGAPNLVAQPPRMPLAGLTQPQDKTAAAAPTGSHPALALELLQGSPKSAADPTPDAAVKLLDAAAKDIVAGPPAPTAPMDTAPSTTDQPAAQRAADANDAVAAQLAGAAPAVAAAPATASPATALPIMAHAAAEQVAIGLRQAIKSGVDHIQIQLQPAELGAIAVKLNVNHDGRVTMVVSADRSDTLNLLQQDASTLAQALRDAGLQADNSSLSFNLRGFQMNQQTAQGSSPWRDAAAAGGSDDLGAAASVMPTLRRHSGALDIHV